MKINIILKCFLLIIVVGTIVSCNKPEDVVLKNEGTVYMPQAVGNRSKIDLLFTSTSTKQDVTFGAAYGGVNFSGSANNVTFIVDATKLAAYNAANGTNYSLLPASSYDLSGLTAVIPAGATSSEPLTLTVKTNTITQGIKYLLPITLSNSSAGPIDSALQTTYFRFDTLLRKTTDVTGQGTLSVSNENGGGAGANEGSPKLVDNNTTTKYLFSGFNAGTGAWFKLQFNAAVSVGAYTFTSANDADNRDPRDWKLQGSNDGSTWTDLDVRTAQLFPSRFLTRRFEVPVPAPYTQYRIFLSALNTASPNLFQMGEWRVLKYD